MPSYWSQIRKRTIVVSGQQLELCFYGQSGGQDGGLARVERLEGDSLVSESIQRLAHEFAEEYGFGDKVQALVWGIASWCDYLAVCITLHPTHSLQYMIQSTSKTHVVFSHLSQEPGWPASVAAPSDPMRSFPSRERPFYRDDVDAHRGGVLWPGLFDRPLSSPRACNPHLALANVVAPFLRAHISGITYWQVAGDPWPIDTISSSAVTRDFSAELAHVSRANAPALIETANARIRALHASEENGEELRRVERCAVAGCGEPVLWESHDVGQARCAAGHRHARCALTALALANPFVVKRCEACARAYLDEQALDLYYADAVACGMVAEENMAEELGEDGVAWMLAEAALCVYCGGKFVRDVPLPRATG